MPCNCNPKSPCCAEAEYLRTSEGRAALRVQMDRLALQKRLARTGRAIRVGGHEVVVTPGTPPYARAMVYTDHSSARRGRRTEREVIRQDVAVALGLRVSAVNMRSRQVFGYPGADFWDRAPEVGLRLDQRIRHTR